MSWNWHEGLCPEDHMHSWQLSSEGWQCLGRTRDNPEPVDAIELAVLESYEWISVSAPMLSNLTEMIADAKKEIAEDARSQFLKALHAEQSPIWLEAARNHEAKKDLYGSYRNYTAMVDAIQDLNQRARHDRVSTNNRKQ